MAVDKKIQEKIDAQLEYCRSLDTPSWMPHTGHCYSCHRQIMDAYSLETLKSTVITGCPYCHKSYCE